MSFLEITRGRSPLVLGLPHTGTEVPDDCAGGLNARGRALADTDWQIDRVYADLVPDVTTVRTRIHRYVIDVNRDPGGVSLYPGQNTTALCPTTDFDGAPIYHPGAEPDGTEIVRRRSVYHHHYHVALTGEMDRVRAEHGFAILYDCHSIRSEIPFLFEGPLPDFNIGTAGGTTCAPEIEQAVTGICAATGRRHVVNGRFKGGWTTRHYGRPEDGWHALQMELAQSTYLAAEAPPWALDAERLARLRETLAEILTTLAAWRPA